MSAAKIVGENCRSNPGKFQTDVNMWVFEEDYKGGKLTDAINKNNENVKYLPNIKLGKNVKAEPSLAKAIAGADLLVFVTPHQFMEPLCKTIKESKALAPGARAISLTKGMNVTPEGFQLISGVIGKQLGINCSVLMGANIANEVAKEQFAEATVGFSDRTSGNLFRDLFQRDYFDVTAVPDVEGVELCGTLKNIVALGAGFADGLQMGNNTKAAMIRVGLVEMVRLSQLLFPQVQPDTFFQSCGVADLITTCFGGRNRACAEAFVKANGTKSFDQIEQGSFAFLFLVLCFLFCVTFFTPSICRLIDSLCSFFSFLS